MDDFFTLDDTAATLEVKDLLFINLCDSILAPDLRLWPAAITRQGYFINSIKYSR